MISKSPLTSSLSSSLWSLSLVPVGLLIQEEIINLLWSSSCSYLHRVFGEPSRSSIPLTCPYQLDQSRILHGNGGKIQKPTLNPLNREPTSQQHSQPSTHQTTLLPAWQTSLSSSRKPAPTTTTTSPTTSPSPPSQSTGPHHNLPLRLLLPHHHRLPLPLPETPTTPSTSKTLTTHLGEGAYNDMWDAAYLLSQNDVHVPRRPASSTTS